LLIISAPRVASRVNARQTGRMSPRLDFVHMISESGSEEALKLSLIS